MGLENFLSVLKNSSFQMAAKNTATFSAVAVPLAVVLSLGLALMLECRIPGKSLFRTFFLSPMMVPVASVVLIWQVVFHYNGTLNEVLAVFGAEKIDWLKSQYAQIVIVILFLWKNLGYNMILFMAALNNIPKELLEVADVEGASPCPQVLQYQTALPLPHRALCHHSLPLSTPSRCSGRYTCWWGSIHMRRFICSSIL